MGRPCEVQSNVAALGTLLVETDEKNDASGPPPQALRPRTPCLKELPSFQSNNFRPERFKWWDIPLKTGSNCVFTNSSKGDSPVDGDIFL